MDGCSNFSLHQQDSNRSGATCTDRQHDGMTSCLKEPQCSETNENQTRLPGSRREAKAFPPTWPRGGLTEEMSGVHLASISSIMSPSGLELTGLSTEPRLHGDSSTSSGIRGVLLMFVFSFSTVSLTTQSKASTSVCTDRSCKKLVPSVCPVLLKPHKGEISLYGPTASKWKQSVNCVHM